MIFYLFYYILSTQKWKKLYPKSWGARVKKKDIMIPTAERPILQCGWTTTINVILGPNHFGPKLDTQS